ncbi:MAG: transcription antitermination factor NusB [Coriobacteriia bacterium]|nr:transcription antitermination factor NusB [Coriobacteriia bacterium]
MTDKLPQKHSRTFARYWALRLLYQRELLGRNLEHMLQDASQILPPDQIEDCLHSCEQSKNCEQFTFFELFATEPKGYGLQIVQGIEAHQEQIDEQLNTVLEHWALYRMPPVDCAIARIGAWEVLYNDEVPDSVAINEAVTLAKEFGGDDSSKFVNGVLGKIAKLKTTS